MLISYKKIIISSIVILLDGIIVYYIPSSYHNLSYLYPMLTISLIPFIYQNKTHDYYKYIIILGIIYDIFYSNIFLLNALVFFLLGWIDLKIIRYFKNNIITYLFMIIVNILVYDLLLFFLIVITNYQSITLIDYLYKIKNSLLLNIIVGIIYYYIFCSNLSFSFNQ